MRKGKETVSGEDKYGYVGIMEVELTGVQTLAVALVSGSRRLEPHNGGGK